MDKETQRILNFQKAEITEYFIYKKLSGIIKDKKNSKVLKDISNSELKHYKIFKKISRQDQRPDFLKIFLYVTIARIFGLTFATKLMEKGENQAQKNYASLKKTIPNIDEIISDEEKHENELLNLLDEERLQYVSSVVLGLNDALVELTGALAGFTLALQNTRLIAIVGLITGIAASMSMAASEYLSTKQEETQKNPINASVYTGIAYVVTVVILIIPYLLFDNVFCALGMVMFFAIVIVLAFTYYISVAKDLSFRNRFMEMAGLSLSIAVINFFIGWGIRYAFGVDV